MAQAAGILVLKPWIKPEDGSIYYLLASDKARFKRQLYLVIDYN